jgi:hypothetical protein
VSKSGLSIRGLVQVRRERLRRYLFQNRNLSIPAPASRFSDLRPKRFCSRATGHASTVFQLHSAAARVPRECGENPRALSDRSGRTNQTPCKWQWRSLAEVGRLGLINREPETLSVVLGHSGPQNIEVVRAAGFESKNGLRESS